MNRRNFIGKTGIIGAASLLPFSSCTQEETSKYKMGYQLYSIRDEMAKDPIATLKALKKMGYEDFETYGYETAKRLLMIWNSPLQVDISASPNI